MIEETQTAIPEGETAPLPASADLPTAALTSTENAANAPVQTAGVAVPNPGGIDALVAAGANNSQQAIADVPPMGPIPADELLFGMNATQAVYLYRDHGLSGANSHDEVIEMLQAKRDGAPAEPAIETVDAVVETVVEEAETLASEAVSEVKKVWNNHLQAWV